MQSKVYLSSIIILAIGCAILFATNMGYKINYSHSAQRGLWKIDVFSKDLVRGHYMEICPPNVEIVNTFVEKGYLQNGNCPNNSIPFLKKLVAIPGDTVLIDENGITVNNQIIPNSTSNKAMPHIANGVYKVKQGQAWFISNYNKNSFDSRYFGAVPITNIIGSAQSILVID